MNNNRKIKRNWKSLRPTDVAQAMGAAATGLTANALVLTTPLPTPADMTNGQSALETAIVAALTGGADERAVRQTRLEAGITLLDDCASYVEWKTSFNEGIMLSCGFQLVKVKETVGLMPQIEQMKARATGIAGEVLVKCPRIRGAYSYAIQYALADATTWTDAPVQNKAGQIITGLDSRTDYKFRMAAIGAAGQGPWSNEVVTYAA